MTAKKSICTSRSFGERLTEWEPLAETELIHYALTALRSIFAEGYLYKKAGVIVSEITPEYPLQTDLFDTRPREKYRKVMKVLDNVNVHYGKHKIRIALQGFGRKWRLKNERLSPFYTTRLSDILEIKATE